MTSHVHADGSVHPEDHSHVGQGAVALDIGDGYGAVILWMPASMLGLEIETRLGETLTHVAVHNRPVGEQMVPNALFPSLPAGDYEFWVRPDGPVAVTVAVPDGGVAEVTWPA